MEPQKHSTSCFWRRIHLAVRRVPLRELRTTFGFPAGISGNELAGRAYTQPQKFGAQMLLANATRLICTQIPYIVELENGPRIPARALVIATGPDAGN
jgi:thioredoxin reductase